MSHTDYKQPYKYTHTHTHTHTQTCNSGEDFKEMQLKHEKQQEFAVNLPRRQVGLGLGTSGCLCSEVRRQLIYLFLSCNFDCAKTEVYNLTALQVKFSFWLRGQRDELVSPLWCRLYGSDFILSLLFIICVH